MKNGLYIKGCLLITILITLLSIRSEAQRSSLIVFGDLHYDLLEDHDMDWLRTKPDDLRQITKEYTVFTKNNWNDFMLAMRNKIKETNPQVQAVVQLGDLSEGLAGSEEKAEQMASNAIKAIEATQINVPWIIAKGNHDITGPGATEAFMNHYIPFFRRQAVNNEIQSASYSYTTGDIQIVCLDPWDKKVDMAEFLEKKFSESRAKFKFVAIHEPVIPVTERCWHTLRKVPEQRERLLETIAKNNAIVLCAHLHKYSVIRRNTSFGPIVQIMVNSVIRNREHLSPLKLITQYGQSLVDATPDWQPETADARRAILEEESKYVTFFKQTDLPGYAIIKTDVKKGSIKLEYYAAFGKKPYDIIDISKLMKK
jgi:hypothetical protein